jgi:hypothetical protein
MGQAQFLERLRTAAKQEKCCGEHLKDGFHFSANNRFFIGAKAIAGGETVKVDGDGDAAAGSVSVFRPGGTGGK